MKQKQEAINQPFEQLTYGSVLVKVEFAKKFEAFTQRCDAELDSPVEEDFNSTVLPDVICSGVVKSICPSLLSKQLYFVPGDDVVIYPSRELIYLTRDQLPSNLELRDVSSIIKVDEGLSLPTAALLSRDSFFAYSAFKLVESYVTQLMHRFSEASILIIGRSVVGLFTLGLLLSNQVESSLDRSTLRVAYADANANNVDAARKIGCRHFLYWKQENYEKDILSTTFSEMPQGADVIVDFVSSYRSISRSLNILNPGGMLFVGGNSTNMANVSIDTLFRKSLSLVPIQYGTRDQMKEFFRLQPIMQYR